jgi:hypothetical protein
MKDRGVKKIFCHDFFLSHEFPKFENNFEMLKKKIWIRDLKKTSVADPDPGSGDFLTPGSGIRDEQPRSYFPELRNHFLVFWR